MRFIQDFQGVNCRAKSRYRFVLVVADATDVVLPKSVCLLPLIALNILNDWSENLRTEKVSFSRLCDNNYTRALVRTKRSRDSVEDSTGVCRRPQRAKVKQERRHIWIMWRRIFIYVVFTTSCRRTFHVSRGQDTALLSSEQVLGHCWITSTQGTENKNGTLGRKYSQSPAGL